MLVPAGFHDGRHGGREGREGGIVLLHDAQCTGTRFVTTVCMCVCVVGKKNFVGCPFRCNFAFLEENHIHVAVQCRE